MSFESSVAQPGLSMWVIYDSPKDYPDQIVVRRWQIGPTWLPAHPDSACSVYGNIEDARAPLIQRGLHRLNRSPDDDAVIVEIWL